MPVAVVQELPPFDTGEYEGAAFRMADGDAQLSVQVAGNGPYVMLFKRVRWHQFTALYDCSAEAISGAYFRLVEELESPQLAAFMAADSSSVKPYNELHHYRIFLDETGCHEVFAESAGAL